jgi:pyruvate dehydrogenase E1 component alpha subunit
MTSMIQTPEYRLAEEVLRIRLSQLIVNEWNKQKKFKVPVHLALGHEAVAVGLSAAMEDGDRLLLTHRNVHYNLARQPSLRKEMDEYLLKPDGLGGGRYGAMNLQNPAGGVVYTSSILGNNLAVSTGVGLACQVLGNGAVTFVTTGDGAMEEGVFYETLLFLKTFGIAAVVLVENNEWSLATRIEERRCPIDLKAMAAALSMPHVALEGNDVVDYRDQLQALRRHVVAEKTPALVDARLWTLGDWRMVNDQHPDGKFINYHAGVAPTVELSEWPAIQDGAEDPVSVLTQRFPRAELEETARRLAARLTEELL